MDMAQCAPEVEGPHDEAGAQQRAGNSVNNRIVEAATERGVRMGDDGGVASPGRRARRGGQAVRVVDAAVERRVVVDARQREAQRRFGQHRGD